MRRIRDDVVVARWDTIDMYHPILIERSFLIHEVVLAAVVSNLRGTWAVMIRNGTDWRGIICVDRADAAAFDSRKEDLSLFGVYLLDRGCLIHFFRWDSPEVIQLRNTDRTADGFLFPQGYPICRFS